MSSDYNWTTEDEKKFIKHLGYWYMLGSCEKNRKGKVYLPVDRIALYEKYLGTYALRQDWGTIDAEECMVYTRVLINKLKSEVSDERAQSETAT